MIIARKRMMQLLNDCQGRVAEVRAELDANAERHPETTLEFEFENGAHPQEDGSMLYVDRWLRAYVAPGPNGAVRIEANIVRRALPGPGMTLAEYQDRVEKDVLFEDEPHEPGSNHRDVDCPGWRGDPIDLPQGWWEDALKDGLKANADGTSRLKSWQRPLIAGKPAKTESASKATKASRSRRLTRADDELAMHVERWLSEGHKTPAIRREAEGVLIIFRDISEGKPLKDCGRSDGIKLREHLFALDNASQTTQKKLGHLRAALNYAEKYYDYKGPNPFKALIDKKLKRRMRDSVVCVAYTEDDMEKVRAALKTWKDPDCELLWVLCATTGMRRGEAFLVEGEERIGAGTGLRCINIIPTNENDSIKNDESVRTLPIPADAIPYLPKRITGRLFKGTPKNVGKRLNTKLKNLGVNGRGKSLKSTRKRASMRIMNIPHNGQYSVEKIRYEILGHERGEGKKVADAVYAGEYPKEILKPWIDVIGLGPSMT